MKNELARLSIAALLALFLASCGSKDMDTKNMDTKKRSEVEKVARQYVQTQKKWKAADFTVEFPEPDFPRAGVSVVDVLHKDDKGATEKGGGKSVRLEIDVKSGKVLAELRFQ